MMGSNPVRVATLKTLQIGMNKRFIRNASSCENWKKNEGKCKEFKQFVAPTISVEGQAFPLKLATLL
jgi:hypothetical protein